MNPISLGLRIWWLLEDIEHIPQLTENKDEIDLYSESLR